MMAAAVLVIEASRTPDLHGVDRGLDTTARKPDVAQSMIVHFTKRFDRGPALPIRGTATSAATMPCAGRLTKSHFIALGCGVSDYGSSASGK
jgi:hypothetical protein